MWAKSQAHSEIQHREGKAFTRHSWDPRLDWRGSQDHTWWEKRKGRSLAVPKESLLLREIQGKLDWNFQVSFSEERAGCCFHQQTLQLVQSKGGKARLYRARLEICLPRLVSAGLGASPTPLKPECLTGSWLDLLFNLRENRESWERICSFELSSDSKCPKQNAQGNRIKKIFFNIFVEHKSSRNR